jgi:uncharacterized protein
MDYVAQELAEGRIRKARLKVRIGALDALRGFAVFGMLLTHMSEQFLAGSPPSHWPNFGIESQLDSLTRLAVDALLRGKAFALFSLLFGVSFFLQMKTAEREQQCPACWFAWRMLLLLAIGLLHHLLWPGDVLTVYAAGGLLLLFVRQWSDKTLLAAACFLLFGGARWVAFVAGAAFGWNVEPAPISAERQDAYVEVLMTSSLPQVFTQNYWHGFPLKASFFFGVHGRGYQTLGLFMLGLYLARAGWHERALSRPRLFYGLFLAGGGLVLAAGLGLSLQENASSKAAAAVRRTLIDVVNLGATATLLSAFAVLYLRTATGFIARVLSSVGRAGLTAYLSATLIGTGLMYGWGLGMMGKVGVAQAVAMGLLVFALQAALITWWFRHFLYGPVEWTWRIASYGRWEPILKRSHFS